MRLSCTCKEFRRSKWAAATRYQATITVAAIAHLVRIRTLDTEGCRRDVRIAVAKLIGSDYVSEDDDEEDEGDEDGNEDDEDNEDGDENGDEADEDGDVDEDTVDKDDDDVDGVDEPAHPAIPFAGGEGTYSVLSILDRAHSIGEGIFGFLTMRHSNALRGVCKEFCEAIINFSCIDVSWESRIKSSLRAWRADFPAVLAVNVSFRNDIVDSGFVHIRGDVLVRSHTVDTSKCHSVTGAAFVHLRGIHTLRMSQCEQMTITDVTFVHLCGIQKLDMR